MVTTYLAYTSSPFSSLAQCIFVVHSSIWNEAIWALLSTSLPLEFNSLLPRRWYRTVSVTRVRYGAFKMQVYSSRDVPNSSLSVI